MTEEIRFAREEPGKCEGFCGDCDDIAVGFSDADDAAGEVIKCRADNGEGKRVIGENDRGGSSGERDKDAEASENESGIDGEAAENKGTREESAEKACLEFFESHPAALSLSDEIAEECAACGCAPTEGYIKVLERNFAERETLCDDEEFLNRHIYQNEKIRARIVGEYLESVAKKGVPRVMSGKSAAFVTPPDRVSSLAAAKEIVRKMAEAKRIR